MSRPTTRMPVAIFNSCAEFIDGLREALEREGLPTATALLAEIQDGTLDLVAFLEAHDPPVGSAEKEGQYFFYKGADIKEGSNAVLRDADLERLKAAVQKLF
jgi:hypothetical protein